jgi:mycothiol synthase
VSSPSGPEPVSTFDPRSADHASRLALIVQQATRVDGQPPFSDQSLVDLRSGAREGLAIERHGILSGIALVTTDGWPREAELVVSPTMRRRGDGGRLLENLLERAGGDLLIWAHGDHPAARVLAMRHSLQPARQLLQLRAALEGVAVVPGSADGIASFRPGIDDGEWLEINAAAFADHPEQGSLSQHDLDARMSATWFDADDFLVARDATGTMTGFCWLKVDDGGAEETVGEFYAVGVSPDAQGSGLGRRLVNAGLARLRSRGIRAASLYVEADNLPAVALYRSVGFVDHTIDIQYAARRP